MEIYKNWLVARVEANGWASLTEKEIFWLADTLADEEAAKSR